MIVITNPATTLVCGKDSIEVTLANGDVMTIPIEGNINVDVNSLKLENKYKKLTALPLNILPYSRQMS